MIDAKKTVNCPVCTTPCTIVGHTTKHYEPTPREIDNVKLMKVLVDWYRVHCNTARLAPLRDLIQKAYTSGLLWEEKGK